MRHKKLLALLITATVLAIAAAGVVVFANSPTEPDTVGRITDREAWLAQIEGLDFEALLEGFDREAWRTKFEGFDCEALRESRGSVGRRYFRDIDMENIDFPFDLQNADLNELIELRRNIRAHIERGDFDFSHKREMLENGNFQGIFDALLEAAGQ